MRVSVVCPDLSNNCLGRALLLAELASAHAEVQIVGIRRGPALWAPAARTHIPIREQPIRRSSEYVRVAAWLARALAGTRVIVSKPLATSLGLAVAAGARREHVLLDVDDWELGLRSATTSSRDFSGLIRPGVVNSYWSTFALDKLVRAFPFRLAANQWLQKRFGGVLLPHVRDTDRLDPSRTDARRARHELQMGDRIWVGFVGTVRPHKGIEDLIEALATLPNGPGLFLGGADEQRPFVARILEQARARLGPERLRWVGLFDTSELAKYVAAPDVICLPSRAEPAAVGQIPAKVFDAMALGKAIVATAVNDLPEILGSCGVLVGPGNARELADAIAGLAADERKRNELGALARKRAVESYSHHVGRRIVRRALVPLEAMPGK